jgi:hypothetical protein
MHDDNDEIDEILMTFSGFNKQSNPHTRFSDILLTTKCYFRDKLTVLSMFNMLNDLGYKFYKDWRTIRVVPSYKVRCSVLQGVNPLFKLHPQENKIVESHLKLTYGEEPDIVGYSIDQVNGIVINDRSELIKQLNDLPLNNQVSFIFSKYLGKEIGEIIDLNFAKQLFK